MDGAGGPSGVSATLGRAGLTITAANALVNLLAYLVPMLGARRLDPTAFGELATAMALVAVATMPAVGLQTAVAVATAHGGTAHRSAGRLAWTTAACCGGVLLVAGPLLAAQFDLSAAVPPLLAAITVPAVVVGWPLGVLQGREAFGALAAGMMLVAVGRYAGVIIGLSAGGGVPVALACGAAVALAALPPLLLIGARRAVPEPGGVVLRGRDVFTAANASLAILLASYADLILARRLLPPEQSGAYAVGVVLTRAAMWTPQMVTVVALPRLVRGRDRTLGAGLALILLVGAVLVAATTVAGAVAVRAVGGVRYTGLADLAPYFVAVGALYAATTFLITAQLARRARWPSAPLWLALAGLLATAVVVRPATVAQLVACALGAAAASVLATGAAVSWRRTPVTAAR